MKLVAVPMTLTDVREYVTRPSRPRIDRHPLQAKLRWEVTA